MEELLKEDIYFTELPATIYNEVLSKSDEIGEVFYKVYEDVRKEQAKIRENIRDFIRNEIEFGYIETPTTCGVDGAYVLDRLFAIDLMAAVAVAVEGLIPPREEKIWEKPQHKLFIHIDSQREINILFLKALMSIMEIKLAVNAPHDVIFLDGSFTTPLIAVNQILNKINKNEENFLEKIILKEIETFFLTYKQILEGKNIIVAIPKFTTRKEFGNLLEWKWKCSDKAVMTLVLKGGEYTFPIKIEKPVLPSELLIPEELFYLKNEIINLLNNIHIIYYRPYDWTPVFRIELPHNIVNNQDLIGIILKGIKHQCGPSSLIEPYPLYISDRFAKSFKDSILALKQSVALKLSKIHEESIQDLFFYLHTYRTEG